TKYFITDESPIILSSFNASIDGQLSYNPGFAKLTIGGSYRIGTENTNDIVNTAELTKDIAIVKTGAAKKDGLKIAPTITLYTGTQSFYETYYTTSQVQRAVENPTSPSSTSLLGGLLPGASGTPQPTQTIITETDTEQKQQEVKQYTILALSGTMPITYAVNK